MRRLTLIVLFGTLILPKAGWSSDTGTSGAQFLKLGVNPRAVAMGDAQVGLADDVYSNYWNPAGLASLRGQELGLVDTEYVQNISQQYLAYALPRGNIGTFGLNLTYLGVGGFQGYDASGATTGNVRANDMALGFSYSHYLYYDPRTSAAFSAGLTGKWIQESLDSVSAKAYAADVGLLFSPGLLWGERLDGFKAGFTVRNLGSSLAFDQESFPLPRIITAGGSYTGHLWGESMTLAVDERQPNDGPQSVGIGLELSTLQALVLRAGYTTEGDLGNGLRFGVGLRFKTIEVDYAYANEGDFGATNRLGITLKFSPPARNRQNEAQVLYDKAEHDFKRERYTDAMAELNKTLQIDPSHPQAVELLEKTYENIKNLVPAQ